MFKDDSNSTKPRRSWLFRGLLLVLVLAAIDGGAHLLLWLAKGRSAGDSAGVATDLAALDRQQQVLHPFLGYVFDPVLSATAGPSKRDPGAVEYGFPQNSSAMFGERSPEHLVVALFGGSVATILANNGGPTLQQLLPRSERFAGREVMVLSLALPGFKQPQQLMTLNYFLNLGVQIDIAINLDGFNDIALPPVDNLDKGIFPFFPRSWYLQVEDLDHQMRRTVGEVAYLKARQRERQQAWDVSPWRLSGTASLIHELGTRRLRAHRVAAEQNLVDREPLVAGAYQVRGPSREYDSRDDMLRDVARFWQRSSRQMHHLCAGLGIEYYHFLQPNQYDPGSKPLSAEERQTSFQEDHHYRPGVIDGYPLLRDLGAELRAEGIAFHDLSQAFQEVEDTVYIDACCHFNRKGNVILARRIAKIVQAGQAPI